MRVILYLRPIVLACLLYAGAEPVHSHDYWSDGKRVDPQTKNLCCSGSDTKELDPTLVKPVAGGFLLTDTHEFIPADRVQPSPDSAIWASRWGGETRCFFYPFSF